MGNTILIVVVALTFAVLVTIGTLVIQSKLNKK